MKCLDREQLFAFANHLTAPQDEEMARSHVAGCPACRATLEEYQQLNGVLDDWKAIDPPPWFEVRVRQALARKRAERPAQWLWGWPWARALAPALLLLIVVAGSLLYVRTRPRENGPKSRTRVALTPSNPAGSTQAGTQLQPNPPAGEGEDEVTMYENLPALENYDMLADFDVLSELTPGGNKVVN